MVSMGMCALWGTRAAHTHILYDLILGGNAASMVNREEKYGQEEDEEEHKRTREEGGRRSREAWGLCCKIAPRRMK